MANSLSCLNFSLIKTSPPAHCAAVTKVLARLQPSSSSLPFTFILIVSADVQASMFGTAGGVGRARRVLHIRPTESCSHGHLSRLGGQSVLGRGWPVPRRLRGVGHCAVASALSCLRSKAPVGTRLNLSSSSAGGKTRQSGTQKPQQSRSKAAGTEPAEGRRAEEAPEAR
jgi:hypothetical protein